MNGIVLCATFINVVMKLITHDFFPKENLSCDCGCPYSVSNNWYDFWNLEQKIKHCD